MSVKLYMLNKKIKFKGKSFIYSEEIVMWKLILLMFIIDRESIILINVLKYFIIWYVFE